MLGVGAAHVDLAAGDRHRGEEGRRLDAVGDGPVRGRVELVDTLDLDARGPRPRDVATHRAQQGGEVLYLGFPGRVLDHRRPLGEHRRRQDVVRRRVARVLEDDARADEAVAAPLDVAVLRRELGAQLAERPQVHVDRPRAEVVAAGQ